MAHLDLVSDILQRITQKHRQLPPNIAQQVEDEVRADWGGERHYIPKVGDAGRALLADRDRRIRADYRRGESIETLARKQGISIKRIQQIVAGQEL